MKTWKWIFGRNWRNAFTWRCNGWLIVRSRGVGRWRYWLYWETAKDGQLRGGFMSLRDAKASAEFVGNGESKIKPEAGK